MPENFRTGPRLRELSSTEVAAILLWMLIAYIPLAALEYNKKMAASVSYAAATVALIVLLLRIVEQTDRIFERLGSSTGNLTLVLTMVILVFVKAVIGAFTVLAYSLVVMAKVRFPPVETAPVTVVVGLALMKMVGFKSDSFKEDLVVMSWLYLAHLSLLLGIANLMTCMYLYASVMTLWAHSYFLVFEDF